MTATRELARYKLDLVGVQEVRWARGGTVRAGDYIGRSIFSVITNIYNKKTKGPTYLNGIVHSHRKTEKGFFFLTTIDVRCVQHG